MIKLTELIGLNCLHPFILINQSTDNKKPDLLKKIGFLIFRLAIYSGILFFLFGVQHIHILEVISQVFAFIFAEDTQGEADQGPEVDVVPAAFVKFTQIMNLRVAIVAGGNAI